MQEELRTNAHKDADDVELGMVVEASGGDLGEEDVSKPKVADIVRDQNGHVRDVVVTKGTVFRKRLDIAPERIQAVEQEPQNQGMSGKVTIEASEEETEALAPV